MQQNNNTTSDKNMLGEFFSTVFRFLWKLLLWVSWALFRAVELISGGVASWIKSTLTQ